MLIFAVVFVLLYVLLAPFVIRAELTWAGTLLHAGLSFALVFGFRLLFKVYHQVIRYGNPGAFARMLAADLFAGLIYTGINLVLPKEGFRVMATAAPGFVIVDLLVCFFARLVYYYLYLLAQRDDKIGTICAAIVRRFAMVDAKSEEVAMILSVEEWSGREADQTKEPINEIQRVAMRFQIHGEIQEITPMNQGYINRTYRVRTLSKAGHTHWYTLQRINTNVFPNVEGLMENYQFVTEHLRNKLLLPGHTERGSIPQVKLTQDGKTFFRDDSGVWRLLTHFTGVYGMNVPENATCFYYAGQSFGEFLKCMSDVPIEKIHTVIPNFHNTYSRYLALEEAIKANPANRLSDVWDEINFIRERRGWFRLISDALEEGRIPLRITHNDCNLNNILFSEKTRLPVAIIDLDTVMPGSPLYDYGDSMRIGTNTAEDDEKDLSKVSCNLKLYESYAKGYLEACGDILTKEELELLPYAAEIITIEDGIRFLADHLNGDTSYKIFYPGQNLDRARTQLKLVEDMEKKLPEIRAILNRIYQNLGLDADPYRL